MRNMKLLLAAAAAVTALGAAASSAGAYRATIERAGAITATSLGKITFGSGLEIECNLTLRGTLAGSAELVEGTRLGAISEVRWASCTGGTWERYLNLPWTMSITSIEGVMPDEAGSLYVSIRRFAYNISTFFELVDCLYEGDIAVTLRLNDTGTNTYTTGLMRLAEELQLPFIRGSELCPEERALDGTFSLTPQQSITVS